MTSSSFAIRKNLDRSLVLASEMSTDGIVP